MPVLAAAFQKAFKYGIVIIWVYFK